MHFKSSLKEQLSLPPLISQSCIKYIFALLLNQSSEIFPVGIISNFAIFVLDRAPTVALVIQRKFFDTANSFLQMQIQSGQIGHGDSLIFSTATSCQSEHGFNTSLRQIQEYLYICINQHFGREGANSIKNLRVNKRHQKPRLGYEVKCLKNIALDKLSSLG